MFIEIFKRSLHLSNSLFCLTGIWASRLSLSSPHLALDHQPWWDPSSFGCQCLISVELDQDLCPQESQLPPVSAFFSLYCFCCPVYPFLCICSFCRCVNDVLGFCQQLCRVSIENGNCGWPSDLSLVVWMPRYSLDCYSRNRNSNIWRNLYLVLILALLFLACVLIYCGSLHFLLEKSSKSVLIKVHILSKTTI